MVDDLEEMQRAFGDAPPARSNPLEVRKKKIDTAPGLVRWCPLVMAVGDAIKVALGSYVWAIAAIGYVVLAIWARSNPRAAFRMACVIFVCYAGYIFYDQPREVLTPTGLLYLVPQALLLAVCAIFLLIKRGRPSP